MNPRIQRVLRILLIVNLVLTVLSVVAALVLFQTDRGRRWTADAIEHFATREIPGHMKIGRLTQVGHPTIVEDLRFFHPKGHEVLHVRHAEVDFVFLDALRGKLSWERALARGGRLSLAVDPDGRPSIEAALDHPTVGVDPNPDGGLHYAMRDIAVEELLLVMPMGKDSYRIRGVKGLVSIRRELTQGIRIELRNISGGLEPEVAGYRLRLQDVDGWVHGGERQVLQLNARAAVGDGGRMAAKIALFDRKKTPVEVELKAIEGVQSSILALLLYAQGAFSSDLSIEIESS